MSTSRGSLNSWVSNTWTTNVQAEENGDEIETIRDGSTVGSGSDEEYTTNHTMGSKSLENEPFEHAQATASGSWVCHPYKIEQLERQLYNNSPGASRRTAIIETLRQIGVKVFVIDSASTNNAEEVVQHIRRVVGFVARESCIDTRTGPLGFQRCLLYQDEQGRLFNLMLPKHSIGPAETWLEYLESFSGCRAMMALTILCRSLPCMTNDEEVQNLKPAYLSLILGLVLTEEISLSWLNTSMMIRGMPSVSACSLSSPIGSDSFRKAVLFTLALAGATSGLPQSILTSGGIIGACLILLANLGARSWHFLRWNPVLYSGHGSFLFAYFLAVATGFVLPYMGHRSITIGGKGAMEYVLKTAMLVAALFVLSDYDEIQKFLIVGSQNCNQNPVNLFVGAWWTITLLSSLFLVRRIPYQDQKPEFGERLLIENQASPVGYKVPSLPDFEIDPSLANTGSKCLSLNFELSIGLIMAVAVGTGIIWLSVTSWEDHLYAEIDNSL